MLLSQLKGVGPRIAEHLARLHLHSLWDVLFHLPIRYEDRTRIYSIAELQAGDRVLVEAEIVSSRLIFGKRASLLCKIADGSGEITCRFFHFNADQKKQLSKVGARIRCFGEVRASFQGGLEMVHPQYQSLKDDDVALLDKSLTPIYPTTKGLSQTLLRKITQQALTILQSKQFPELLPEEILQQHHFMPLKDALNYIHRPPIDAPIALLQSRLHPAQQRLAFEELLAQRLALRELRQRVQQYAATAMRIDAVKNTLDDFIKTIPFDLTHAQRRVVSEIQADIAKPHPMLRLLQGDVGSGKTMVAMLTALAVVKNGFQVALMAPTEILAEQHDKNFRMFFENTDLEIVLLTGSQTAVERKPILEKIQNGSAHIVIGTHALFQEAVEFHQLALVIVDEQHRFGVHQRLALKNKGIKNGLYPHQLIMTATPIPRTLTMTAYADLEVSIIDEMPKGRLPVQTLLVDNKRRDEIIERVASHCCNRGQAYWVCTLIEESEVFAAEAAHKIYLHLKDELPNLKIGLIHGRMKANEKDAQMQLFKRHEYDLLVATTVIEVGVDVANASLMVIENAERLGLSQLHQLRGRVGRGVEQSYCVLMYKKPLTETAKKRLQIMRETTDGFKIAEEDLQLRGPGEILGTQQAGSMNWRFADLLRDQNLLPQVKAAANLIQEHYPNLTAALVARWLKGQLQYADV